MTEVQITDEQINAQREKYMALVTEPSRDEDIIEVVSNYYKLAGYSPPRIEIFDNPLLAMDYMKDQGIEIKWAGVGINDFNWIAFYEMGEQYLDKELFDLFHQFKKITSFYDAVFDDAVAVVVRKPTKVVWDDDELSCYEGAAVAWPGFEIYVINGKRVKDERAKIILCSDMTSELKKLVLHRLL